MTDEIKNIQDEIVEEFNFFEDWQSKYEHIIELGKTLAPMPVDFKKDENLIKGCQSKVWVHPEINENKIRFYGDSDALIVKGLVALILRLYSDKTPKEILDNQPEFIERIGLQQHLSPTRNNGLSSLIKQIKMYAVAYSTQQ